MMGKDIRVLALLGALVILAGCYENPDFSEVPDISFENIRYVEADNGADSLILSFNFTDGDGNVGLRENEVFYPFHSTNYVIDASSVLIYDPDLDLNWVRSGTERFVKFNDDSLTYPLYTMAIWENLPVGGQPRGAYAGIVTGVYSDDQITLPPLRCDTYTFIADTSSTVAESDTILISPNDFKNNIVLDFYRKRGGVYELITNRFSNSPCVELFNSRIPIFEEDNLGRPIVGTINYPLISRGFKSNFLNDSIMIEMYIYDRELNRSNVLRVPDFTLPDLIQN